MSIQYVQVNVGRNKSGTPMPQPEWDAYIWAVASNIITSSLDGFPYPFERLEGTVARFDEDGQLVEEDTLHLAVMIDIDADALRRALAATAKKYGQDAIALILGSELIEGNEIMDNAAFEDDVWESVNNSLYTDQAGSMEYTGIVFTVGETWQGTLYGTEENDYGQRAVYRFENDTAQRYWFDAVTGA